jgi:hypothetical protein
MEDMKALVLLSLCVCYPRYPVPLLHTAEKRGKQKGREPRKPCLGLKNVLALNWFECAAFESLTKKVLFLLISELFYLHI